MNHTSHTHDPTLVVLSVVIAVIASYTALDLGNRVTESRGRPRLLWLAGGATAMGIGIWSMHFTGMLAFRLPGTPIAYDVPLMLLSILVAIAASLLALRVIARPGIGPLGLLLGGLLMGVAIAGMHYTGMASMRIAARLTYDPRLVLLSVAIAVGASIVALRLAVHYRTELTQRAWLGKLGSALVMGVAITGLHYTGMAAARFTPLPGGEVSLREGVLATSGLATLVVTATLVILGLTLIAVGIDRWRVQALAEGRAFRQSEERLRRFHDALGFGVLVLDTQGNVVHANSAASALLDVSMDQIRDSDRDTVLRLFPDVLRHLPPIAGRSAPLPPTPQHGVVQRVGAAGRERYLLVDAVPLPTPEALVGQELILSFTDVTERQRAEEMLERRVEERTMELRALNAELEAFTYSASHDLRAPLRGINGFAQALEEDCGEQLDAGALGYVRRVRAGAERMGSIIDALLMLSQHARAELRLDQVDLTRMAGEVAQELREREPDREVTFRIQEGMHARADASLVRVMLENLLGNALKYTQRREHALVEVGVTREGVQDVFFVRDNGAGFDMAYADRLFMPFRRLHGEAEFSGMGIGLATVQRIVHRHGGRVWARGMPDEGATFSFTFSLASRATEGQRGEEASGLGAGVAARR